MKKFLTILFATIVLASLAFLTSSCKDEPLQFEYAFNVNGHATGDVHLTFPGGDFNIEGNTELAFSYSSLPASELFSKRSLVHSVTELRETGEEPYLRIADAVENDYEAKFTASSASGTYYLHITGIVKEHFSGLEVSIDKVLTNEELEK